MNCRLVVPLNANEAAIAEAYGCGLRAARKQLAGGPGSGGRIFYRRLGHTLCLFAIDFDKIRAGGQRLRYRWAAGVDEGMTARGMG